MKFIIIHWFLVDVNVMYLWQLNPPLWHECPSQLLFWPWAACREDCPWPWLPMSAVNLVMGSLQRRMPMCISAHNEMLMLCICDSCTYIYKSLRGPQTNKFIQLEFVFTSMLTFIFWQVGSKVNRKWKLGGLFTPWVDKRLFFVWCWWNSDVMFLWQ